MNSVLTNLSLYFLSLFKAPKWVLRRCEALRRAFFWKRGVSVSGGHCLVKWKTVCKSTSEGGLGILDLENMNTALVAKWWWRLLSNKTHLWRPIIEGLYYKRRKPLREGASFRPFSQWWGSVLKTRDIFKCGASYMIGNGRIVSFWMDIWCTTSPLCTLYPRIYDCVGSKNLRAEACWGANGWRWGKILAGFPTTSQSDRTLVLQLKGLTSGFTLSNIEDEVRWRWSRSEEFSVKSLYIFLQDGGVSDTSCVELWKIHVPLKVKIFIWTVLKRKVLTKDRLIRRGWVGDDWCALCLDEPETMDHLFTGCPVGKAVLSSLLPNKLFLSTCFSTLRLWESSRQKGGDAKGRELATSAIAWWSIWLARNKRIFENKRTTTGNLLAEIRSLRALWDIKRR